MPLQITAAEYEMKGHTFRVEDFATINWIVAPNRRYKTALTNALLFGGENCMENVQFRALTRDPKLMRFSAGPNGYALTKLTWSDGEVSTNRVGIQRGDRKTQPKGPQFVPIRGFIDDIATSERRAYRFLTRAALASMTDVEVYERMTVAEAEMYGDFAFRVEAENALVRLAETRDLVNKEKLAAAREARTKEEARKTLLHGEPPPTDAQLADAARLVSTNAATIREFGVDPDDAWNHRSTWADVTDGIADLTEEVEELKALLSVDEGEPPKADQAAEPPYDAEDIEVFEAYNTLADLQAGDPTCIWCGVKHGTKWAKKRIKSIHASLRAARAEVDAWHEAREEAAMAEETADRSALQKKLTAAQASLHGLARMEAASVDVKVYLANREHLETLQRRRDAAEQAKPLKEEAAVLRERERALGAFVGKLEALEKELGQTATEKFLEAVNKHMGDYALVIEHDPLVFFMRDTRTNEIIEDPSGSQQIWMLIAMIIAALNLDEGSTERPVLVAPDRGWSDEHAAEMTRALGKDCPVQLFIPSTVKPKGRFGSYCRVLTEEDLAPVDEARSSEAAAEPAEELPTWEPPEKAPHWMTGTYLQAGEGDMDAVESWWRAHGLPQPGPRKIPHDLKGKVGTAIYHAWTFEDVADVPYRIVILAGTLRNPQHKTILVHMKEG